jgi:L-fucose mutarotase/ribose pyranase (RbsD/FucU family)
MLKGIPSIISPELLKILMEMGHGDELVIGDGNFPAANYGKTYNSTHNSAKIIYKKPCGYQRICVRMFIAL